MTRAARATAAVAGLVGLVVLAGYAAHAGALVDLRPGLPGMSPLTAMGLVALAGAVAFDATPGAAAGKLGWVAVVIGAGALVTNGVAGRDIVSPWVAGRLFQFNALRAGCIAAPTALGLVCLGLACVLRDRPKLADRLAAATVVVAGFAVLDDAYEAKSMSRLPLFAPMALHTALALLALALASLALRPQAGWASIVASRHPGGAWTRRLIAFAPLPPLLGWVLLRIADVKQFGLGAALAAFVVLTVVPLALLVLRGGRILDALERERRTKAELQAARDAELRMIADALPVLIAFVDRSLTYRFANRSYESWIGRTPDEIVGRRIHDIVGAAGLAERAPQIEAVLAGREVRFELAWPFPDGRPRDADVRYLPRLAADGSVGGFFIFVADVTERKAAERRLVATNVALEERVEARTRERDQIWQASKDMLCIATLDGFFVNLNPAWTATLGWSVEEMIAEPFIHFVHPDDVAGTLAAAAGLARGEAVLSFENRYRHADGGWRWLSWNAVTNGEMIYATVRDVSDAKAAAERERQLEEALRQAQKMEAVGQLTGGLAHDFNNLLTGITGSLDLMSRRVAQGRTGELGRYIEAAQGAAMRAAALTHRLLAFSRRQTLDPKPTDVNRLVAGLADLLRRTVGPAIGVEIEATDNVWSVLVDPNQLENALLNLCINARDAMPDGGRITIVTSNVMSNAVLDEMGALASELAPGPYVALRVVDTGTGMSPEIIERIFDPFFTTKPLGQGTGLGLSMIYGFARQSGGKVTVESELGHGTTMSLYLPRWHGQVEAVVAAPEVVAVEAGGGASVLVVDDEATVRMLVVDVLEELGYRALEAADGQAGLDVLHSSAAIDLLVTDVGMPGGMNGRQLAEAGRAIRPGLRVLFITGYAETAVLGADPLDAGMRVLPKPFAMEAFGTVVKEMIAMS